MKAKIQDFILTYKNFLRGSTIIFVGGLFVNILSYVFNLLVGPLLGEVKFGELYALLSVLYFLSVPAASLTTVATKYIAQADAQKDYDTVGAIIYVITKYALAFCVVLLVILLLFHKQIAQGFQMEDSMLLFLLWGVILISFPQSVFNAAFIGLEMFVASSLYSAVLIATRIVLTLFLLYLGYSVGGVFWAMILAGLFVCVLSVVRIEQYVHDAKYMTWRARFVSISKKFLARSKDTLPTLKREMFIFSLPSTLAALGMAAMVQMDVILAKIFLHPYQAGLYSSLAITGKVIYLLSQPIVAVMFPQITRLYAQKKPYFSLFSIVLGIVGGSAFLITLFYYLFPDLVLQIFWRGKFLDAKPYLAVGGIFQSLYALVTLFVMFFLAIGKLREASMILVASLIQLILLIFFHDSIYQFIYVSIFSASVYVLFALYTIFVKKI